MSDYQAENSKKIRFVSWNVNGIRAVAKKGFFDWFEKIDADFICLQETKVNPQQIEDDEQFLHPKGYHSLWAPAQKPGYSGVMFYSRHEPDAYRVGLGQEEFDSEGRVIELDFKNITLVNAYFPNSQREHGRLGYKLDFCKKIHHRLEVLRAAGRTVLVCGDFNIAHHEIDLKNPKSNKDNAGFLPEERAWLDGFVASGWVDTFRKFEKGPGHYTWWSYRPGVREKNIGWRLDYFFVNPESESRVISVRHQTDVMGSDHCPVILDFLL
jgi:exodeoxyribonuclease III